MPKGPSSPASAAVSAGGVAEEVVAPWSGVCSEGVAVTRSFPFALAEAVALVACFVACFVDSGVAPLAPLLTGSSSAVVSVGGTRPRNGSPKASCSTQHVARRAQSPE